MFDDQSLLRKRIFIAVFATLIIVVFVAVVSILYAQYNVPIEGNYATTADPNFFPSTATQFLASPTQISSSTPVAPATPTSPLWEPLSPISNNERGLITNGDRTTYQIALTFDVCQSEGDLAGFDTEIIRVLTETQTSATFFLGGQWIRDHQTETLQLANNTFFELGNHSWSHRDFSGITPDEMQSEILLAQQEMYKLLGYQTNLFRLPYGTYNEEALTVIGNNGLYVIQWDVVSGDPDPNIDAGRMTNGVLQQIQPGSIVIMHANGRGWHTAEALPGIIQSIRQQGYTFVTVSDLLGIQPER